MPLSNTQRGRILIKKTQDTLRDLRRGEKSVVRDVLSDLKQTRIAITSQIRTVDKFEMTYLRAMQNEIDRWINEYQRKATETILTGQDISLKLGSKLVPDAFSQIGITFGMPMLSDEIIAASRISTTDLIRELSDEMRNDINRSLRVSILSGENTNQAARKIDDILGIEKKFGYMNRSDIIARQEINHAFSVARQITDEQMVRDVKELRKQWWTAQDERVRPASTYPSKQRWNHRDAHGQIRRVDEPFRVSGEDLLYPRDPSGNLGNILGCRCQSIPYIEGWE